METTATTTRTASRGKSAASRKSPKQTTTDVPATGSSYRPALLGRLRDLTQIRYDYPLVLVTSPDGPAVRSLSSVVNGSLQQVAAKGIRGERMRKNVLQLEAQIRSRLASGETGRLSRLWDEAAARLLGADGDADAVEKMRANLERARAVLGLDGEVVDCDEATPSRVFVHVRDVIETRRARGVLREIEDTILRLSDILDADALKSNGRRAAALAAGVGSRQTDLFDFEVMSKILVDALPADPMPARRRKRIEFARSTLESQKFFATVAGDRRAAYPCVFESCEKALEAFHERLPAMVDFVKALRIADLELANRYREDRHDPYFDSLGADSLDPEDLAIFPSMLVCLRAERLDDAEVGKLFEVLASGLPIKVLLQSDDLLEGSLGAGGRVSLGGRAAALARMAVNLGGVHVLQCGASSLYQLADDAGKGLEASGPALFSVFSGAGGRYPELPAYLVSAAATQSRAFPTFVFDPAAGADLAERFSVGANPAPDQLWSVAELSYEDPDLQRLRELVAFTPVDFLACDARFSTHFSPVEKAEWSEDMAAAAECVGPQGQDGKGRTPWIWMVDGDGALRRLRVGELPMRVAAACAETWRSLQELGGVDSSHARRLLERERQVWEEAKEREIAELKSRPQQEAPAAPAAEPGEKGEKAPAEVTGAEEPAPSPDEPYIETPRCTSCNECTNKNNRMFAYNENKQAYIKDPDAGTYRELVEAAEKCQVAIIHPGKPRNPDEPNLEDLMRRAEAFN